MAHIVNDSRSTMSNDACIITDWDLAAFATVYSRGHCTSCYTQPPEAVYEICKAVGGSMLTRKDKKLSCRRKAARRRSVSLKILLRHSRSL